MARKRDEAIEAFDYYESRAELVRSLSTLHFMRMDEMPRIELYRDQLLSIVSSELAPLYAEGERIITGSMVNNYVKQGVIPAPSHRRYTRRHLAYLLFVCTFKRVLPISEVAELVALYELEQLDLTKTYDNMATLLEHALASRFSNEPGQPLAELVPLELMDQEGNPTQGALPPLLQAAVELVANKLYLEKQLSLEVRRRNQQASAD